MTAPFVEPGRIRGNQMRGPFAPIDPSDVDTFAFDFTAEIGTASIVSTTWTCALASYQTASDPLPQAHILGVPFAATALTTLYPPDLDGSLTGMTGAFSIAAVGGFTSAVAGAVYRLGAEIVTSDGRTLEMSADLPVVG